MVINNWCYPPMLSSLLAICQHPRHSTSLFHQYWTQHEFILFSILRFVMNPHYYAIVIGTQVIGLAIYNHSITIIGSLGLQLSLCNSSNNAIFCIANLILNNFLIIIAIASVGLRIDGTNSHIIYLPIITHLWYQWKYLMLSSRHISPWYVFIQYKVIVFSKRIIHDISLNISWIQPLHGVLFVICMWGTYWNHYPCKNCMWWKSGALYSKYSCHVLILR